jgi:tetratricopeptide (TPR) repeat protein
MNKRLLLLFFLPLVSFSQTAEELFATSFCECFEKNNVTTLENVNLDLLKDCLNETLQSEASELTKAILKEIDTTNLKQKDSYQIGYDYGQNMLGDVQDKLINDCDAYYEFAKGVNTLLYKNIGIDSNQKKVDSLSNLIKKDPKNIMLIWERGANNLGIQNIEEAQTDFKLCLDENADFFPARFFLAVSYDAKGNYDRAIKEYQILVDQSKLTDLGPMKDISKMFLALAKRKTTE